MGPAQRLTQASKPSRDRQGRSTRVYFLSSGAISSVVSYLGEATIGNALFSCGSSVFGYYLKLGRALGFPNNSNAGQVTTMYPPWRTNQEALVELPRSGN